MEAGRRGGEEARRRGGEEAGRPVLLLLIISGGGRCADITLIGHGGDSTITRLTSLVYRFVGIVGPTMKSSVSGG
ncbi:hypothetical protein EYF80_058976 [Liparis tanakae]|uniref:Uncharacterized protein n=1 Tax=Liparis tanakae TaxID=230148 RepID=A0A4Z2EQ11_9TELE|nr:hypothetical protein EYF80_058976 [Liparis tanakae]